MARIPPANQSSAPAASAERAAAHQATGRRMTNMEWTVAHSPAALEALLQAYSLHDAISPLLGERRTWLFCHAISTASECLTCSTFFRRLLIDSGENPDAMELDEFDELIVDLGWRLSDDPHSIDDALHAKLAERLTDAQIVTLVAYGAIMIATTVVNDALRVELDGYLEPYRLE